jgi:PAS domain S-box-containing protein
MSPRLASLHGSSNGSVGRSSGLMNYLQRYGLAVASTALALGASLLLQHFGFRVPSEILLLFAVAISSWYGGPRSAVLALVLSVVSFYWYFIEPVRTLYIYRSEIPFFIIFTAFAALLSWFGTVRRRGEADLREQAALLNLTHDTIFVMDMQGVIKYWNRGAEEQYGWTADQAVGKVVHDLLRTVFPASLEAIKTEVTRTGRWEGEVLHSKKDGSQLVAASRWSLERGKRGVPIAILETNNDITERKRADEALRRLNRELRAISNCNQALLRATDEKTLLDKICRIVCEEAGYHMAFVAYAEQDEAKSVRPVACTGIEEKYIATLGISWADTERGRGVAGTAIRTGRTCCTQDFATDPRVAPWREISLHNGFRSAIAVPLKGEQGRTFGSLNIFSEQPHAFTAEEIRLVEELAGDLTFGIVTLRSQAARKQVEESLRQSEAYLAESERLTHTGSWALDLASSRYIYVSKEDLQIWGIDPREAPPDRERILERIHPDDRKRWKQNFDNSLIGKTDTSDEYRIVLPEGTVKYLHTIRHPVLNSAGEVVRLVGTTVDITDRKRTEQTLRQSEAYLAEAQRLSHTGSFAFDVASNKYVYISEECFRIFELDPQHSLPSREAVSRLIHPDDWGRAQADFDRLLRDKGDTPSEFRIVLPSGTVKHIHVVRHPVLNEAREVVTIVGTAMDITERKRADEALRLANAYNRGLIEASLDPLVTIGPDGKITDVNAATESATGRSRGELIGTDFCDYFTKPANARAGYEQAFLEGLVRDYPLELRHRNGQVMSVSYNAAVYRDESGEVVGVFAAARDITERKRAEEALRESEMRFRIFVDHAADALCVLDEERRIIEANREACQSSGYTREELIGKVPQDFDPDVDAAMLQRIDDQIAAGKVCTFETRNRRKDGILFPVEVRVRGFQHGGRRLHLILARDISERKRAEEALRRSEAYLAEAQRLTHTGSWALDAASREYTYWSDEMYRIFGVDATGGIPIRETMSRRIHPADARRANAGFEKSFREKTDTSDEYRFVLPDGTVKHIESTRHPVLNDAGDVVQLVGTFIDITERKRAEEALRESETRFRKFVDHTADAFFMLDFQQKIIIDVNQAACDSLGYTRQELIGQTPLAFHLDSYRAEMKSLAEQAVAGESVFDRHWHRRKDGTLFPVEVHTNLVWYEGRRFLLKVARDISDHMRAEEQREKLRQLEADLAHINRVSMMGELTASIAHEVNQPLSGIVSNASACLRFLALDTPDLEEVRDAARDIVRDGKRAGEVIARIRSLTRRAVPTREKLDLNQIVHEVLALVSDGAKKNCVVIRTELAGDVFAVLGDRVQLQQVVLNLVMNGIEAMSSVGEQARELVIGTRNVDSNQVQVTIRDSGIGLDPKAMTKIFEPFYTTKPSGMGMGLSICRSILAAHDGRLWAATNDGPGTSFHFTVPKYCDEQSTGRAA